MVLILKEGDNRETLRKVLDIDAVLKWGAAEILRKSQPWDSISFLERKAYLFIPEETVRRWAEAGFTAKQI
jgi:hypothetical protein